VRDPVGGLIVARDRAVRIDIDRLGFHRIFGIECRDGSVGRAHIAVVVIVGIEILSCDSSIVVDAIASGSGRIRRVERRQGAVGRANESVVNVVADT